jgi:hypothetical protein
MVVVVEVGDGAGGVRRQQECHCFVRRQINRGRIS